MIWELSGMYILRVGYNIIIWIASDKDRSPDLIQSIITLLTATSECTWTASKGQGIWILIISLSAHAITRSRITSTVMFLSLSSSYYNPAEVSQTSLYSYYNPAVPTIIQLGIILKCNPCIIQMTSLLIGKMECRALRRTQNLQHVSWTQLPV